MSQAFESGLLKRLRGCGRGQRGRRQLTGELECFFPKSIQRKAPQRAREVLSGTAPSLRLSTMEAATPLRQTRVTAYHVVP